jgi:hypothetical protein
MAAKRTRHGGARRGSGRPPKAPHERLSARVLVTFTEVERVAVVRAAGDESVAGFLRRLVMRNLPRHGGRRV